MARSRSQVAKLSILLLAGILAGVALGVAALPTGVLVGFGLGAVSADYDELPRELSIPPTAQRSYLYANDGKTLITSFYAENRHDVPLAEVAPLMRQAVVAAEDSRFYRHSGVDLRSVVRAFVANQSGGEVQGASTLTMQYVRNVLKNDPNRTEEQRAAATEMTTGRKLQEIRYALALEKELAKDEILSRYLNIAYFGAGAYGVAAASQRYFSKPAAQLTLAEAALLAGLVRSPHTDDPIDGDVAAALGRRSYVLDQMVEMGVVSAADAARAKAEKLALRPSIEPNDCTGVPQEYADWGFFCDYFQQWWNDQPAFGETVEARQQALRRGGYSITTSLDPGIQARALKEALEVYDYSNERALPTAVVQPGTGRVLALAVNRHYSLDENPDGQENYPNTVNQLVAGGGDIDGYQAGSTFKMFTMLAALESDLPLSTGYDSPTKLVTKWPVSGPNSCKGYWCPSNAKPEWMDGYRTMWTGFGRSVNTYFVHLTERIGADAVVEMAERLGITFRAEDDAELARNGARTWGPFTLGVSATTPLDLANAYATVAAEGRYCQPLPVVSIRDSAGRPVYAGGPICRQVLHPDVARAATDAARCPVGDQSAFGRCNGGTATQVHTILKERPIAGKTGSSDNYATETVVIYTPQLAVAAIAANPDDPHDLVDSKVQAKVAEGVARIMVDALRDEPRAEFVPPPLDLAFGIDE
ncbi:transglycosylase domain-containing protein [Micromonospora sonneratiae]|uniref:Transglycosylase domain-containing protein n=1 Tax=Micromonospora sonneratiae TaxID=1184706 RepID=A0ABW3YHU3_9ACTN